MTTQSDHVTVISADGHVGLRTELYRPYVDPDMREAFDEFTANHLYRWTPEAEESMFASNLREEHANNPRYSSDLSQVLTDPTRRISELDSDGVSAEVLFPDDQNHNTPPWLAGIAPSAFDQDYATDVRIAGARAYNRWLAEFCSAAPERLLGQIAIGSLGDVDAAVAEVRRAHASGLTAGVFLPLSYNLPLYHHPRYEPLWETLVELDLTITVHAGDGGPNWYGDGWRSAAIYMAEMMFFAERPLWCFIFGGVFERHPDLKVVFTEQGSAWVPTVIGTLDAYAHTESMKFSTADPLPMLPSEMFAHHCVVGNSLMRRADVKMRDRIGVEQLAWGSDFPHFEGSWPEADTTMARLMAGVPENEMRAIMGGNIIRAYNLDAQALSSIAGRVGPVSSALVGV